jgi:hypothetical protein
MVPAMLDDKYIIRFSVNSPKANEDDMRVGWELIKTAADKMLKQNDLERMIQNELNNSDAIPTTSELTSMRRLRFGISKMVSDPRNYNQKKYRRTATSYRIQSDSGKYLARNCSMIEKDEDIL